MKDSVLETAYKEFQHLLFLFDFKALMEWF
jgi:hypothetical protein